MAFYEHYITEYTVESGRYFWTLPNETLDEFRNSASVYVLISYNNGAAVVTPVQNSFEMIIQGSQYFIQDDNFNINFTTGSSQITLSSAPNADGIHVQLIGVKLNFIRPTSTTIVSLQEGYSTVTYEFIANEDVDGVELFCKGLAADGVTQVIYTWGGSHAYGHLSAEQHVTNTLDIRDMFNNSSIAAVNGRTYTISVKVQKEDYFYSFDWAVFRLSDGQRMVLRSTAGDTVTANKLLAGTTAHCNDQPITGTMPNNGAWTGSITNISNPSVTIPEGYHNGLGNISVITTNITAGNIKKGVPILGVTGTYEGSGGGPDLSGDTVSASVLASGYTAHDKDGEAITGSYVPVTETPTGDGAYTIEITTV